MLRTLLSPTAFGRVQSLTKPSTNIQIEPTGIADLYTRVQQAGNIIDAIAISTWLNLVEETEVEAQQ